MIFHDSRRWALHRTGHYHFLDWQNSSRAFRREQRHAWNTRRLLNDIRRLS